MWADVVSLSPPNNAGGVKLDVPPLAIPANMCVDARNCYSFPIGSITKRAGKTALNSTAISGTPAITGIFESKWDNGTTVILVGTDDGKVYIESAGAITTAIKTGQQLGPDYFLSFAKLNNLAIWANGTDAIQKYDGTTVADLSGSPPLAKVLEVFNDRVWFINIGATPFLIAWSGINAPETIDLANNILNFYTGDGDPVITAKSHEGTLYVFQKTHTHRVFPTGGYPAYTKTEISSIKGCVSPWGAVSTEAGLLFIGSDNIYRATGNTIEPIGNDIRDIFLGKSVGETPALNTQRLMFAQAGLIEEKKQAWFLCSTGPSQRQNVVWIYDWSAGFPGQWFPYDITANVLGKVQFQGRNRLYSGDYAGKVFKQDQGNDDNGTAIDAWRTSGWIKAGEDKAGNDITAKFMYLVFWAKEIGRYYLEIWYRTDFDMTWTGPISKEMFGADENFVGLDFLMGISEVGAQDAVRKEVPIMRRGRYMQIQVRNRSVDPFTIYKMALIAQPVSVNVGALV